jgi:hypothetical protein
MKKSFFILLNFRTSRRKESKRVGALLNPHPTLSQRERETYLRLEFPPLSVYKQIGGQRLDVRGQRVSSDDD